MESFSRRRTLRALAAAPLGGLMVLPASAAETLHGETDMKDDRLAILEDRQRIQDVLMQYARGWDRLDEQMLRDCFFPDATHEHGGFEGQSQDFITGGLVSVGKVIATRHMITNIWIEVDGDRAISECYFAASHRRFDKTGEREEDYFLQGRYLDRFERREGRWKIAHRLGVNELKWIEPRLERDVSLAVEEQRAHRKPLDPYYAMLEAFRKGL